MSTSAIRGAHVAHQVRRRAEGTGDSSGVAVGKGGAAESGSGSEEAFGCSSTQINLALERTRYPYYSGGMAVGQGEALPAHLAQIKDWPILAPRTYTAAGGDKACATRPGATGQWAIEQRLGKTALPP